MITFKTIRWKNLLSTGNAFTEIQLNKTKSTLIIGDNGAGKSTILDALTFVLFGKPFRSVNKNQLVNSVNQGGTVVEIEFSIGSKEYIVKRGIKKNFFEIWQNGQMLNQDASIRDYQEYLEKTVLKLNYKSFTQIVVLGSSTFIPFMQLKASDRRTIIEDLLDIEIFSVMNQLLKVKVGINKEDMGTVDVSLGLAKGEEKASQHLIEKLKENKTKQISKNKKDIKQHETYLKNYQESINEINEKIEGFGKSISDETKVRTEINKLLDYQKGIEKGIIKYEEDMEFYEQNSHCDTCEQEIPQEHRDTMIEQFHGKMHEMSGGLVQLGHKLDDQRVRVDEIDKILNSIQKCEGDIVKNQNSIQACTQYINKVSNQIDEISQMADDIDSKKYSLEKIKENIKIYIGKKEALSNEKYLYELAGTLLKDGGIKSRIIKQYLPIINKYINLHLGKLDFYVSFELDEGFNETIRSRYRDEFTYASFSEGEKMRIDLALLFTWRAIAKLKNSVNTNLLILDEVFDSSLDTTGTDEFLKILYDLTGDVNVFVISHKGDILYDRFKSTIKFDKHKNFSRMV
jgi:DNA repair exonuclease SbcCD ATPase subunit